MVPDPEAGGAIPVPLPGCCDQNALEVEAAVGGGGEGESLSRLEDEIADALETNNFSAASRKGCFGYLDI